ncbi:MAG: Ribonuclease P protein component 1 [Methanonatronarchaeales archaeon]|nr:Ribonuclease P protein component 1 [Methanonatronarchaeales archaeon]
MRPGTLIGRRGAVVDHSNPDGLGIEGRIRDETRDTLRIGGSTVPKSEVSLELGGDVVDGELLVGRQEERL